MNLSKEPTQSNCVLLQGFAYFMLILLILSIIINSLNIWKLYTAKLATNIYLLLIVLSILNLISLFIEAPFMIYSSFNCKYILNLPNLTYIYKILFLQE